MKRIVRIFTLVFLIIIVLTVGSCKKKAEDAETSADTTPEVTGDETAADTGEPDILNPLTGLEASVDYSKRRPVSVMVNNIYQSLPQWGLSKADIIYECLAEGGITRLMIISSDYENLPVVGSVRSARDYYIDFAMNHDAIFVHAGGSDYAYEAFETRSIDHIDGVRWGNANTFYRDQERLKIMASEHTMMTTGEGIKWAIDEYFGFNKNLPDNFDSPMDFVTWGTTATYDNSAPHINIPVSNYQVVDYVFDEVTGEYLRFQYRGEPHIDAGNDNKQLSFKNVIILYCDSWLIPNDPKNRIAMNNTGEGTGYYATMGTYQKIAWKKASKDEPMAMFDESGEPLLFNRGKTFINVCNGLTDDTIDFNSTATVTDVY